jgi:hypothetical protein
LEDFYKYGCNDDLIIVDEYDCIVKDNPYFLYNSQIKGLWQFRDSKVFAFSATSSDAIAKLIKKCIAPPINLRFMSEYELLNGVSPI